MNNKIQIARQLRQEQTKAEKKLWDYLRNRQFHYLKFRRQHPLKEYILDFFCVDYGIVIELDGGYHQQPQQLEKDELRDIHLRQLGYYVLRFENKLVFKQPELIFKGIEDAVKKQSGFYTERKNQLEKRKKLGNKPLTSVLSQGRGSYTVLTTKKLTLPQQELLLNAGVSFVAYDAIEIEYVDFDFDPLTENAIFTSQNAVRAFLKKTAHAQEGLPKVLNCFCVGEKTKTFLEENGQKVIKTAKNALELAQMILKTHKTASFLFFCGNRKRAELPNILTQNDIEFTTVEVYRTHLRPKKMQGTYDGILFFSPSAVESFTAVNGLQNAIAFCIGGTTASEAKKHTKNIVIANKPTVENTLVQVVKYFNASAMAGTKKQE
ncbi:uroporphyrinogen-III synthase [Spongiimicrobium sp. 2-473A-2-J]|uniref:uroporphyrinogen-III synthase n=1 Tax=Eudoraea algarum TaxID=3417568 RepID=UPI003D361F8D